MSAAGELRIDVDWDGTRVRGLAIASTRPRTAQLLVGRTPAEAVKLVPLLHSICGHAQHAAAAAAVNAALGVEADEVASAARDRRVLLEATQEHLWRLLLDWPALYDVPPSRNDFQHWHRRTAAATGLAAETDCRAIGADLLEFCDRELLPCALADWPVLADTALLREGGASRMSPVLAQVVAAEQPATAESVALLPELSAVQLERILAQTDRENFARQPTLDGAPQETGALAARRAHPLVASLLAQGRGLLARVVARLDALIDCARRLAGDVFAASAMVDAHAATSGIGLARVHTARGMLLHRVELARERIAGYTIVAPTEWNFHPRGPLTAEWSGRAASDESDLRQRLRAWVLALDPCVAYRIEVRHA